MCRGGQYDEPPLHQEHMLRAKVWCQWVGSGHPNAKSIVVIASCRVPSARVTTPRRGTSFYTLPPLSQLGSMNPLGWRGNVATTSIVLRRRRYHTNARLRSPGRSHANIKKMRHASYRRQRHTLHRLRTVHSRPSRDMDGRRTGCSWQVRRAGKLTLTAP